MATKMTITRAMNQMRGGAHFHCCTLCRGRYSCNCEEPERNGPCQGCRTPHERALWDRNHDPKECCATAQMVTDPEMIARYRLGGPGPWYRCQNKTCRRINGVQGPGKVGQLEVRED